MIADHINSSVTAMLATAQEMCPNVLQHDSKSLQDLTSVCDNKSRIPNDFVKNLGKQTKTDEGFKILPQLSEFYLNYLN